jgi:hypothetical protein
LASTIRRNILWLVGAFVLYEVIGLAFAAMAGATVYQNLSDLAKDGPNQKASLAISRVETASHWAALSHFMLSDPILQYTANLPHVGADLKLANLAMKATVQAAPFAVEVLKELPPQKPLGQANISSISPKIVAQAISGLSGVAKSTEPQLTALTTKNLDFGLEKKVRAALPVLGVFADQGDQIRSLATSAAVIVASGNSKPSYWFLANQNLAEARGTGGLIGSYAVIQVHLGRIRLVISGSDQNLNALGPVDHSSLPLNTGIIWQDDPKIWQDLNPSAHTPYAARQIADTWLKYHHQKLDGVIFMGQGIAQYLVAAFGPIPVANVSLTGTNTADYLAKGIYAKYTNVDQKNAAVQKFMQGLMQATKNKQPDLKALFNAIAAGTTGDRIAIWSANAVQQKWNLREHIAGAVSAKANQDVTISVNNSGGNKLEAYLHVGAKYALCLAKNRAHLDVSVTNNAPKFGLPAYTFGRFDLDPGQSYVVGSNLETVTVYMPIGAQLSSLLVDGQSMGAGAHVDRGHQILVFDIQLDPGQTRTIQLDWVAKLAKRMHDNIARVETTPLFSAPTLIVDSQTCG